MTGVLGWMTSKGQYNVGLARRHGVEIEVTTDPPSAAVPSVARRDRCSSGVRRGAALLLRWTWRRSSFLVPVMAAAFFATYRGETLAAAIVVFFGPRATYLASASRREHREVMGEASALQPAIMAFGDRQGRATYDLYVIDVQGDRAEHSYRRFSQFKRRFEARTASTSGVLHRPAWLRPDRRCDAPLPAAPGSRGGTRLWARSVILHTTSVAAGLTVAWSNS